MAEKPRRSEEMQLRIRETAYLMWEAGGRRHGGSLEYWLAAERELLTYFDGERAIAVADALRANKTPGVQRPLGRAGKTRRMVGRLLPANS